MQRSYKSIQYLRAIAALMVVAHHASNPTPWLFAGATGYHAGEAGVDIFFVISGFIMFTAASHEGPADFARRRFVRVAPLYWIATIATFLLTKEGVRTSGLAELDRVALSMAFVPHFNPAHDGNVWPFLVPGWTLNYEMFFYILFAIGLALKRPLEVTLTLLCAFVALSLFVAPHSAIGLTYTDTLLLEFGAGLLIGRFRHLFMHRLFIATAALGFVAIALAGYSDASRVLIYGVPAALIVAGAVAWENTGDLPQSRLVEAVGNQSYSIYLFQGFAISIAAAVVKRLPLHSWAQLIVMILAAILAAAMLGALIHRAFEVPLQKALRPTRAKLPVSAV